MDIALLGPLELDGTTSTMGLRDRVVLEALAVRPGTVVRAESLAGVGRCPRHHGSWLPGGVVRPVARH